MNEFAAQVPRMNSRPKSRNLLKQVVAATQMPVASCRLPVTPAEGICFLHPPICAISVICELFSPNWGVGAAGDILRWSAGE